MLAKFGHIEAIPESVLDWQLDLRNASRLAATLTERRDEAMLYRRLATLNRDADLGATTRSLDDLEWHGVPRAAFIGLCDGARARHRSRSGASLVRLRRVGTFGGVRCGPGTDRVAPRCTAVSRWPSRSPRSPSPSP